jgi:lipopolysaccharide transport protein LptA
MALSHPDRRVRGSLAALITLVAAGALHSAQPARVASEKCDLGAWKIDSAPGTLYTATGVSFQGLELRQCTTLLRATKAESTPLDDKEGIRNTTWKLSGDVHFEFDGAVLEAQAATVVFADGRLKSVQVQPAPQSSQQKKSPMHLEFNDAVLDAQTATVAFAEGRMRTVQAQGAPAKFSHQLKGQARRVNGHSNRIDYDSGKGTIRLSGDAGFSDGRNDFETQALTYSLREGWIRTEAPSSGTLRSEERVPAPRTPDRATAP